jgi:hypothetical protein
VFQLHLIEDGGNCFEQPGCANRGRGASSAARALLHRELVEQHASHHAANEKEGGRL